jgi:hypothetical protein
VERELASRPGVAPPAGFRGRVLAAVARELDSPHRSSRRWWAGAAAAAVLWANLSLSVAHDAGWRTAPEPDPAEVAALAAEVHALLPDLPEPEARRLVTRTWPARWPAPGPAWRDAPVRPALTEELPTWDTR